MRVPDIQGDVAAFSKRFDVEVRTVPIDFAAHNHEICVLRRTLISDEYEEIMEAIDSHDLVGIADGAVDLIYVVVGLMLYCGVDLYPVWNEVHRTNMLKVGGGKNSMGKILKPPGWLPPELESVIDRMGRNDPVDHPTHYNAHPSGVECIDVAEHMNYCLGNAIKYIWRCGLKDGRAVEDLKKAVWFLQREIARLERGGGV